MGGYFVEKQVRLGETTGWRKALRRYLSNERGRIDCRFVEVAAKFRNGRAKGSIRIHVPRKHSESTRRCIARGYIVIGGDWMDQSIAFFTGRTQESGSTTKRTSRFFGLDSFVGRKSGSDYRCAVQCWWAVPTEHVIS
jgi:hypothetical protein